MIEQLREALTDPQALVKAASALHDQHCSESRDGFRVGHAEGNKPIAATHYLYALSYCLLCAELLGKDSVKVVHKEAPLGIDVILLVAGSGLALIVFNGGKFSYTSVDEENMGFDKIHAIADSFSEETKQFLCDNVDQLVRAAEVVVAALERIISPTKEH